MDTPTLKKYLPRGTVQRIAKKHKRSEVTVSRVLNGHIINHEILDDLLEVAESTKSLYDRIEKLKQVQP